MTQTIPPAEQPPIDLVTLEAKQQDLSEAMTQVQSVVAETKEMLAQIAAAGQRLNDPELVQLADDVNGRIGWLRKLARRGDTVATGAVAALKETMAIRDELAGEIHSLTQAIKLRNKSDPRLKKLVEYLEEDLADSLSWVGELQTEGIARNLCEELGLDQHTADFAAEQIQELFSGDYAWTPSQREAVRSLVVSFQENHDWMGEEADDEEYD